MDWFGDRRAANIRERRRMCSINVAFAVRNNKFNSSLIILQLRRLPEQLHLSQIQIWMKLTKMKKSRIGLKVSPIKFQICREQKNFVFDI